MTHSVPHSGEDATARKRNWVDALYRQYSEALTRFLTRQRLTEEEAADIIQETYCRIQQVPELDNVRFPQAFLFRTALNLVRRNRTVEARWKAHPSSGTSTLENHPDDLTPFRILNGQQELNVVREILHSLSPKCRRVFIMNRFEDLSYPAIARELGISVSMVEKYVGQALTQIRTGLNANPGTHALHLVKLP